MKRKLTIFVLCALFALIGILALTRGSGRRVGSTTYIPVITQNGKLTVVPNPAGYATMSVVMDMPRSATNASPPAAP